MTDIVLTCIIVEDEMMARRSLETLCRKNPHLNLLGAYDTGAAAIDAFTDKSVDLILLDIELPDMSGLDVLGALPLLPQVVFTTGSKEYAYDAFEYDVTDFLAKPIAQPRFVKAIEKVVSRHLQLNSIAKTSAAAECYVKVDKTYIRLPYSEILYFENIGDYVKVVTTSGSHLIYSSLKSISAKVGDPRFLKVHRSYVVNLRKIKDIEDQTLVIGEKVIPVSRAHWPILLKSIHIL